MKVAIIGSGIAGLACSVRLAVKGYEVHVFEANDYPGGKLIQFNAQGFRFDAGPSVSTLPHLVDELFLLAGKNPRDHFNYRKKDVISNYFYPDGTTITGYYDNDDFADEVYQKLGVSKLILINYLKDAKEKYELASQLFLENPIQIIKMFLSRKALKAFAYIGQLDLFKSMHFANEKNLIHPKLVQIFDRYATFNGSDPYKAPGILNSIAHLEYGLGTYFIDGGFYSVTRSIYQLAKELKVEFHFNSKVSKINVLNKKACGVTTRNGTFLADIVVSNVDVIPTYKHLLENKYTPKNLLNHERSSSMLIFYWGVEGSNHQLDLHNVFFSENYEEEFNFLFNRKEVYQDPTIYINISSKEQKKDAPSGCENWFTMVNVPANEGQNWDDIIAKTRSKVIQKLNTILNIDLESNIVFEEFLEPRIIEQRTSSYKGSIYGASSNSKFSAFLRQSNHSKSIKGLYFCGGSVHPGGGTPLCLLSAKITAEKIIEDVEN
ncbi:MAG: phytoene desaturase [Flavobacteriales bacterium]|jgi:phytoene desaturase|nr:phytoene desaturase [Flavobacteriales bacterium]MBT6744923.1 phytoene desaturase [Flavobacteriales bacterium]